MKKDKIAERKLTCPACRETTGTENLTKLIAQTDLDLYGGCWDNANYLEHQADGFIWACDTCLSNGTAWQANTDIHNLANCGCKSFLLAYFDQERTCQRCSEQYIFTKEEQKHWYEELKFYMASIPNECAPCRKAIREENSDVARLSRLIPRFKNGDTSVIPKIVEIYVHMNKVEAAKKFLAQAKHNHSQEPEVIAQIKALRTTLPANSPK